MIFRFSFPCRPPGLRRCLSNRCLECPRLQGRLLDHCQIFAPCWWWWNRCSLSAWSCRRPSLWTPLGSKIQVLCAQCTLDHRIKSGRFARPHAGDIANRRYSRHSVTFDRREQINARARVCEAQSGTEGGGRTARRTRSMICIRSEAMPRTSDRRAPELQCSRPPGTSWVLARSSVCGSVPRVARDLDHRAFVAHPRN